MVSGGRLVCRAASTTESVSVRSRTASTAAEAVAAEDVEDDIKDGDDDLRDIEFSHEKSNTIA